tara:strand:+ start:688 stop:897 length:210 start_codon:yes stop_codon:yes gene_type:complete
MEDKFTKYFNNFENVDKLVDLLGEWYESEVEFSKRDLNEDSSHFNDDEFHELVSIILSQRNKIKKGGIK